MLLLPPPSARASVRGAARIDEFAPWFQFEEFHERTVRATPEHVDRAIRSVPAEEIRLFRLLTWIRNPRRPWIREPENILNPPSKVPILDVATRSGFVMLSDEPGREIVLGTLVVRPAGARLAVSDDPAATARRFTELSAPGYAKVAEETGLSRSAVQAAIRRLLRRKLVAVSRASATATPEYSILRPWQRG